VQELAQALERESASLQSAPNDAVSALELFERCDAWRRPCRLQALLQASQLWHLRSLDSAPATEWQALLSAALAVDSSAAARDASSRGLSGPAVGVHIRQARLAGMAKTAAQSPTAP
jgi:tRNA nucleotidyltransferase (CCA-adding enzyme)